MMRIRLVWLALTGIFLQACGGGGGSPPPPASPPPPPNRAPVALDQSEGVDPDTVLTQTLLASDADGDVLTFAIVDNPASGVVILGGFGNEEFTYTPNPGFAGADTFTFSASDGDLTSNTATVTVNVNFKPVATAPSLTTSDAATVSGTVTATDSEGDAITFLLETPPLRGNVTEFDEATADFTYAPNPIQDGADSFRVRALDAYQASDPAVVNIEIFNWADNQQFGGAGEDRATTSGFFADADGNLYFGGSTESQLGSGAPIGGVDAWLRKTDRRGNELWTRQFGSVDDENSRIIAPAPDGSGVFVLVTRGPIPVVADIFKFDFDGNQLLSAVIDFGMGVQPSATYWGDVDPNGDMWVLSWTDDANSYITKVNGVTGNTTWQIQLDNSDFNAMTPFFPESQRIRVRSVDFDSAGNAIVSGWVVDTDTFSRGCNNCSWLASFDTDGNLLWKREVTDYPFACGEPVESRVYRARVADDDTIWLSGTTTFPGTPGLYAQVSKYNADGTQIQWSYCTTPSNDGYTLFTPVRFAANGDGLVLNKYGGIVNQTSGVLETYGMTLTRLDPDGNVVFSSDITATRADSSPALFIGGDIWEDSQGLIYISSSTDGEIGAATSAGAGDVFLMRFDADGNPRP